MSILDDIITGFKEGRAAVREGIEETGDSEDAIDRLQRAADDPSVADTGPAEEYRGENTENSEKNAFRQNFRDRSSEETPPEWVKAFPHQIGKSPQEESQRVTPWPVSYRQITPDGTRKRLVRVRRNDHGPFEIYQAGRQIWRPSVSATVSTLIAYLREGDGTVWHDLGPTPPSWPDWLNACPGRIENWTRDVKPYNDGEVTYMPDDAPSNEGTAVIIQPTPDRGIYTIRLGPRYGLHRTADNQQVIGIIHDQSRLDTDIRQAMAAHDLLNADEIPDTQDQDDEEDYEILEETPDEPAADQPVRDNVLWPHEALFDDS